MEAASGRPVGAGEVGEAGCRTGEIGPSVKPNDARLGASSAGPDGGSPACMLPLNHDGSSASGRAGGRR
ncbi:hypothetical protein [Actinoplanes sp. NPDC048796]|uniref:hypothetical protein n=1 Tax=Actinoplanes sp. NPDC048796 TaxID=3155640 RepID=UPI0033DC9A3D